MDLNYLYSQHQFSLMSAAAATNCGAREKYMITARTLGSRFRDYQLSKGAPAASSWNINWLPEAFGGCKPTPSASL